MLHATVKETATVGVGKVAAVSEFGVVCNCNALDTICAECAVVPPAAVVIYIDG